MNGGRKTRERISSVWCVALHGAKGPTRGAVEFIGASGAFRPSKCKRKSVTPVVVGEACTGTQCPPLKGRLSCRWRRRSSSNVPGGGAGEWRSDLKGAADRPTSGGGTFKGSFHLALSPLLRALCLSPLLLSPLPVRTGDNRVAAPWYFLLKCPHLCPARLSH